MVKNILSLWQVEPNERPPADGLECWLLDHKRPVVLAEGGRGVAEPQKKQANTQAYTQKQ